MQFPVSGIETAPFIPPLVAFGISFFTSMGGVSGAVLLLPFQMNVLGFTSPGVSATNQLYNVVAIPGGVLRYVQEGRMLWPLAVVVVAGALPGVLIGAVVRVRYLPDPRDFKLFAGFVLLYIGARMAVSLVRRATRRAGPNDGGAPRLSPASRQILWVDSGWKRVSYGFDARSFAFSPPGIGGLSFLIGIVGGVYGIGGGALMAPLLVSVFGLPVHSIAGALLAGTFMTSVAAVVFYQGMAPFCPGLSVAPDWSLGLLFGLGGMAGVYCGSRCQKHVPAWAIEALLCTIILSVAVRYLSPLFS